MRRFDRQIRFFDQPQEAGEKSDQLVERVREGLQSLEALQLPGLKCDPQHVRAVVEDVAMALTGQEVIFAGDEKNE